ncbi:unnamed protein product [Calypogeia fissa]
MQVVGTDALVWVLVQSCSALALDGRIICTKLFGCLLTVVLVLVGHSSSGAFQPFGYCEVSEDSTSKGASSGQEHDLVSTSVSYSDALLPTTPKMTHEQKSSD